MKYGKWFVAASLLVGGCGASFEQLQTRAAADFNCQPGAISARELDSQTQVAYGCGKTATYIESCRGKKRSNCTWMLNSEIRPVGSPSGARQ